MFRTTPLVAMLFASLAAGKPAYAAGNDITRHSPAETSKSFPLPSVDSEQMIRLVPTGEDRPSISAPELRLASAELEQSTTKRKARPVSRLKNPLIVQGPPWPCASELEAFSQARVSKGRRGFSAGEYWQQFNFGAILVLQNSSQRLVQGGYLDFVASTTGVRPASVDSNNPLWEGFFRNARAMQNLSASFVAQSAAWGDDAEARTDNLVGACVARYLAENARN